MKKEYLGDGVYCEYKNGMIFLNTLEGHEIVLEGEVYTALVDYVRRLKDRSEVSA